MLLAITASAFTGSPNPVVWAERAGSTLQSVGHTTEPTPSPEPSSQAQSSTPAAPAQAVHDPEHDGGERGESPEKPEKAEQTEQPEAPEST